MHRRWMHAALLLCGCGRLGFSSVPDADPARAEDASPPSGSRVPVLAADASFVDAAGPLDASLPDGGAPGLDAPMAGDGDVGPPGCGASVAGLVAHLPLDETSGTAAPDVSGNGNNGTLVAMDDADWVSGRLGNALDFDGFDDRVNAGRGASVNDLTTLTMCAWIFPRSYPDTWPAIADKSRDTFVGGWNFYLESNNSLGFLTNRRQWATGGRIVLGAWQHVCASWDGSGGVGGITLWIDGASVARSNTGSNGSRTDSDAARDLIIGRVNNGSYEFDGVIDDYRLYNRVLTGSEIQALFACGSS